MRKIGVLLLQLVAVALASPAVAGGSWLSTPDEHIELGEEVELVGYVSASSSEVAEQWFAYLRPIQSGDGEWPRKVAVAEIIETGLGGYLSTRVYVSFTVPSDIAPGEYQVTIVSVEDDFLADLIGAHLLIGLAGSLDTGFEWALDEPLIAKLPDHATLSGPGFEVQVGDLRAGRYPPNAENYLLDPSILDRPGIVIGTPAMAVTQERSTPIQVVPTSTTTVPLPATSTALATKSANTSSTATLITMLLIIGVGGLVALAARGRKVHVVLGGRPETTPLPADGSERADDYVTVDNQTGR